METANDQLIVKFMIDMTLIEPIKNIIKKLHNKEFRDCDIKWLDNKLKTFVELAATNLGLRVGIIEQPESAKPKSIGEYATNYYLGYFNQLLSYFETF